MKELRGIWVYWSHGAAGCMDFNLVWQPLLYGTRLPLTVYLGYVDTRGGNVYGGSR